MVKGFVSLLFFWSYFFILIAFFLFLDILNFSVVCDIEGLKVTEEIVLYRLLFSYSVVAPTIFFLCAWRSKIFSDRQNKFQQFLQALSLLLIAVSMILFFILFPRESELAQFPYLTANYCFIGTPQNLIFITHANPILTDLVIEKIPLFVPFGSFWTIASHAFEVNIIVFIAYGISLFSLMSVATRVFMASSWPLLNLSVGVLLLFLIAALHRFWLTFIQWGEFSYVIESLGITVINFFIIGILMVQLYRSSHGKTI